MSNTGSAKHVVQFRLRTLLLISTGLAVLAAILGPYYRSLGPTGRQSLLAFWAVLLIWTALSLWLRLGNVLRSASNEQAKYVVYLGRRTALRNGTRLFLLTLTSAGILFYVLFNSWLASKDISPLTMHYSNPFLQGFVLGGWVASIVFALVKRPLLLTEEGIPMHGRQVVPWQYIRNAEWLETNPNAMKLRRYDGDIYIEVPPAIRDDVEAFIREKIGADIVTSAKVSPRSLTGG